ncbi:MAG: SpoIIIAH-like family protein [Syntrophaceticus sp.]|jgi:stage III sporulation protein AH|nr:SpoIIIAH-like family protein [Syntrophaceticus sp.]MDD4359716.1 SpoIIIAH-like family protein [Syntrophaceticus sp.]MDD4782954.1 SpoIIIAH-like family protein [Syntrophaceticus sp.]
MVYFVYNKRTSAIIVLGVLLLLLMIGFWYYVNHMPEDEEAQPAPSVEVKLQQQAEEKRSIPAAETVKKQEFFVDCRLTRDRMRSQQVDVLKEIAGNPATSAENRDYAQQELMKITKRDMVEVELEKLVQAQGFQDAVVLIQENSATVIIQGTSVADSEEEKLKDIVSRVADVEPGGIFVIPKP